MSGPGDIDGEVSGDEAAWRDLIARFDVPADWAATEAPWPAREDLPESADSDSERRLDSADPTGPAVGSGGSGGSMAVREPAPPIWTAAPPIRALAPPVRTLALLTRCWHCRPGRQARRLTSQAGDARATTYRSTAPASSGRPGTRARTRHGGRTGRAPTCPLRCRRRPSLTRFPRRLSAGVIGGPGYLLVVSVFLHWTVSAEAAFIAVAAFIAGFVTLIVKLGDRSRQDDDDDGAVL